jgi:hypothetical protein
MLPKSQVTHDRPQIFPIDRFLSPSKAIAEIVQSLFETPNCQYGDRNRRYAKTGTKKLSTCKAEGQPGVRPLPSHANEV